MRAMMSSTVGSFVKMDNSLQKMDNPAFTVNVTKRKIDQAQRLDETIQPDSNNETCYE